MVHSLKKYSLLYLFVYLTIWLTLSSTPIYEQFRFSTTTNQLFAVLTYLPYALLVLWKLVCDVRDLKKTGTNLLYYLLGFYYVALSGYRMLNGIQIKETLYYSLVLFGSVAAYLQIRDGRWSLDCQTLVTNLKGILLYMIIYKIVFTMFSVDLFGFSKWLGNPPINNLYSTSILAMLLPFLVDCIRTPKNGKSLFNEMLLCLSVILIAICQSRIIFNVGLGMFLGLLLINLRSRRAFLRVLASGLCAVLIVAVLAVGNIAEVRNSLNRATNLFPETGKQTESTVPATDHTEEPTDSTQPATQPDDTQQKIEAQINRSDNMRADLMKRALVEVKKNPLFGTGDLYYTYNMGYKTMEQTAHNFILESLVSYGLVGTVMIAVLLLWMLISGGFFSWKKQPVWLVRTGAYAMLVYYFTLGMVQPSVYNTLLCPLFTVLIAYYSFIFSAAEEK